MIEVFKSRHIEAISDSDEAPALYISAETRGVVYGPVTSAGYFAEGSKRLLIYYL